MSFMIQATGGKNGKIKNRSGYVICLKMLNDIIFLTTASIHGRASLLHSSWKQNVKEQRQVRHHLVDLSFHRVDPHL